MKRAKNRRPRQRAPRATADPFADPSLIPPRPEFLHMHDRHLIWRATLRPAPGLPMRPITWDLRFHKNEIAVRADLDREGEMRDVDFREARGRLNEVLHSEYLANFYTAFHSNRLRRSLYWQRTPDDDMFLEPELPIRWSLARSMCQEPGKPHSPFLRDFHLAPDWSKDDVVSQRIRRNYLRARNEQDLRKLDHFCYRLKMHDAICSPGIEQGRPGILPPLPEQPGTRLLCSVREILNIALTSGLRLEKYIQRIAAGRYALYEITHHDEQAIAGLERDENGHWRIDQIRRSRNVVASDGVHDFVAEWVCAAKELTVFDSPAKRTTGINRLT